MEKIEFSNDEIQESFDLTLVDTNLEAIVENVEELSMDALIQSDLLKDIPVVSTLVGMIKFGANVQDKLFLKKLISFIFQLKDVPVEKRAKMIDMINSSKKYRLKVGEKLMYVIDSCSDYENSELIAHFFKSFIEEDIDYDEFLQSCHILEKITSYDLKLFLENSNNQYVNPDKVGPIISSGLFNLEYEEVSVGIREKLGGIQNIEYEADVEGGELWAALSPIGKIIARILK